MKAERIALMTHEAAAEYLHVCGKTLRALRQQGLIPYVAITARTIRYRPEDLDAYLEACVTREVCQPTQHRRRGKRLSGPGNVVSFTARREQRLAARGR